MIGYYVHHRGVGHLHRALAISAELADTVTILSSLTCPTDWTGGWIDLPLDTDVAPVDAQAGGDLHWVPLGSAGLRSRMAAISSWIAREHPSVMVVDVSVEVGVLARLHGVRTVTFAQPGEREDAAHSLGYRLSSAVVAPWSKALHPARMDASVESRMDRVGAISRFSAGRAVGSAAGRYARIDRRPNQVAVMNGSGGRGESTLELIVQQARAAAPGFDWVIIEGQDGESVSRMLRQSSVVFTHCGQNAVAEVAASRVPAVLIAEDRPHDEQHSLARALDAAGLLQQPVRRAEWEAPAPHTLGATIPAVAVNLGDDIDWMGTIQALQTRDGEDWMLWSDGNAAARAAGVIERVAEEASAA